MNIKAIKGSNLLIKVRRWEKEAEIMPDRMDPALLPPLKMEKFGIRG